MGNVNQGNQKSLEAIPIPPVEKTEKKLNNTGDAKLSGSNAPPKVDGKIIAGNTATASKFLVNLRTEMKRSQKSPASASSTTNGHAGAAESNKTQTSKGFVDGKNFWSKDGLGNTNKHEQGIMSLRFYGIEMVNVLAEFDNHWIQNQKKIVKCILMMWELPDRLDRLHKEENLELPYRLESKLLVKTLIQYCRENRDDVSILFRMLTIFSRKNCYRLWFFEKVLQRRSSKGIFNVYKKKDY